jgi:hypothetical protein
VEVGIMYLDTGDKPLEQKIKESAQAYYLKMGQVPNCVHVNKDQLDGQAIRLDGLRVVSARNVPRHHFWVGVEEEEQKKPAQAT